MWHDSLSWEQETRIAYVDPDGWLVRELTGMASFDCGTCDQRAHGTRAEVAALLAQHRG